MANLNDLKKRMGIGSIHPTPKPKTPSPEQMLIDISNRIDEYRESHQMLLLLSLAVLEWADRSKPINVTMLYSVANLSPDPTEIIKALRDIEQCRPRDKQHDMLMDMILKSCAASVTSIMGWSDEDIQEAIKTGAKEIKR